MLENRTEPMQEHTWWKLHCASCLLVFCAVVWCCWCWLRSEWGKKTIQTYPYSNCTFHHQSSQRKTNKFYRTNRPRENFGQHNLLHVSLSAFWKTGQNPYKNTHGEDCIAQVVCWYFVRLCGAAGVGGEVSFKNNPNTSIFELHFHHQNSQRKQTSFKVPANLIENFDQHNLLYVSLSACWKTGQNPCKNTHGEDCIAQVVCWYFVRLCGAAGVGCEVSEGKKPSKPIHILTALFTTGIHKEYKQVLTYRPTSWKPWPTSSTVRVSVTTFENRTGSMQEQIWSKLHCASCLLAFCAVVWCCLFVAKWVREKNIQTYPYSNCTFHHKSSQRKQTSFKVPANLGENFGKHNLLYVSLSACWKTGQNPCKNKHGENCIAQVVC